MPDDKPLDDARAVGTAAAAAAARVTESVARHVSDAKARERAALERTQDQQVALQALGQVDRHTTQGHQDDGRGPGRNSTTQTYDSTEQRGKCDAVREEAGVPLENRRVVAVADQMNGQDPTLAAAVGKAQRTQARAAAPVPDRTRGR